MRSLNVLKQFVMHSNAMLAAVEYGRAAHGAGNIAESGRPFEVAVKKFFKDSMPSTMDVCSGYFFNEKFSLSKQIDFLLCDHSEIVRLPPAPGMEQEYVPFNSVKVMGHIKNGFYKKSFKKAMKESSSAISCWEEMNKLPGGNRLLPKRPVSFVLIGPGKEPVTHEFVESCFAECENHIYTPSVIFILEPALLYFSAGGDLCEFFDDKSLPEVKLEDCGDLVCCRVDGEDGNEQRGKLLMHMFFGLLGSFIDRESQRIFKLMISEVHHKYPIYKSSRLISKACK